MPKCSKYKVILLLLVLSTSLKAQGLAPEYSDDEFTWRWGFFGGSMTSEALTHTVIDGALVKVSSDAGWLAGLRLEGDKEMWGFDVWLATLQADLDLESGSFVSLPSASRADMYMGGVNLLLYPAGDSLADGRLRPFVSGGAGLGAFDSDFSEVDSEAVYDLNIGLGLKWLLGDDARTALRVDYRWHLIEDFNDNLSSMYRQSLTAGLSFDF